MFGVGKPDSALSYTMVNIGSLGVRLDVVSQDVPGLIEMAILKSRHKQTGKKNCKLNIQDRQLMDGRNRWTLNADDRQSPFCTFNKI